MSEETTVKPLRIDFVEITKHNVGQIRVLNSALLPVPYSDSFYQALTTMWPLNNPLVHMAYHNDVLCGALTARREAIVEGDSYESAPVLLRPNDEFVPAGGGPKKKDKPTPVDSRVYIATIGVLAPYRGRKVASRLLEKLIAYCEKPETNIKEIWIHVHTGNQEAKQLYEKHGFAIVSTIDDYYREGVVSPRSAHVYVKKTATAVVSQDV